MNKDELKNSENIIVGIMFVAILSAMLLLVVAIVYGAMGGAYDSFAGDIYDDYTVINESGIYVNITGYTLSGYNSSWTTISATAVWANVSLTPYLIPTSNYTLSSTGILTNASIIPNATEYNDANISYTYQIDVTADTSLNTAYDDIETNISDMIANFFGLTPTIGTLLAVVILIAAIVILILYVSKMRNTESSGDTFSG